MRSRSLEVKAQTSVLDGLGCCRSESGYSYLSLFEVGEVLQQTLHPTWAEEDEEIVVKGRVLVHVVGHSAIHHALDVLQLLRFEQVVQLIVVDITLWHKISLGLVLDDSGHAEEHLALAVLHILLYVQSHLLGNAEIFHRLGDVESQFLGEREEVINGVTRRKDHCCAIVQGNVLLTKFFCRDAFHLYEWVKYEFHAVA